MLRARAPDGRATAATLRHWATGIGGFALVEGMLEAVHGKPDAALGVLWCAAHAWSVTSTREHRGISGLAAGLTVVDAPEQREHPREATTIKL